QMPDTDRGRSIGRWQSKNRPAIGLHRQVTRTKRRQDKGKTPLNSPAKAFVRNTLCRKEAHWRPELRVGIGRQSGEHLHVSELEWLPIQRRGLRREKGFFPAREG